MQTVFLSEYWRRNVSEICSDPVLVFVGVVLAITHALQGFFFLEPWAMSTIWIKGSEGACYPFFRNCLDWRFFSPLGASAALYTYIAFALATAVLLISRRNRQLGIGFLVLLQLAKNFFMLHDVRLYSAHNYTLNFFALIYLFLPEKKKGLQAFLVLMYFFSGILHFKEQWLSGVIMHAQEWPILPNWIAAQSIYVVVLEAGLCWFLLARSPFLFWFSFSQFLLFHLVSFALIEWLYPSVMILVISLFPVARVFDSVIKNQSWLTWLRMKEARTTVIVLSLFSGLQAYAKLQPTEGILLGDGRYFYAMHQFHSAVECEGTAELAFKDGRVENKDLREVLPFVHNRMLCEPIITRDAGDVLCRRMRHNPDFINLRLRLKSRFVDQKGPFMTVIDSTEFCNYSR
jgi:hypothetical protein